ncbi:hypothetical protein TVAG_249150 [Trichomonas vaginalis G3]|uniref:Uncharacterized protein n=1 Tax=Trichomonas vaginalis (strain ATCC PRA-98 / G3) TaxID=412133 RepID=A2DCB8_TRIV3|nr:protein ubiquitination [Trichomonas vaginalis G3]EAY21855.1 hypothetical protein TVAG_249150 [Trichomonas vaginalis G3]KAI5487675.1 protein ubiquitination [Trichomonas vaginalis G3]|eukprot:XP_001582841.1 hypothetical protein [Trichomonas vaginalis G3]
MEEEQKSEENFKQKRDISSYLQFEFFSFNFAMCNKWDPTCFNAILKDDILALDKISDLENTQVKLFFDIPYINSLRKEKFIIDVNSSYILHAAAFHDSLDILIYLHRVKNVKLNKEDMNNLMPLHFACANNSIECALYIINHLSLQEINAERSDHKYFFYACNSNAYTIISALISKGYDVSPFSNHQITESLSAACQRNYIKPVIEILTHQDQLRGLNSNPLLVAIAHENYDIVEFLINNGYAADEFSNNTLPLFKALDPYKPNMKIVDLIIKNSSVFDFHTNVFRKSTVHYICSSMNTDIAKELLKHRIDVNRLDEQRMPGPTYLSSRDPHIAIEILNLLYENGYDINLKADYDEKPIIYVFCMKCGSYDHIIAWFIKHGANLDEIYQMRPVRYYIREIARNLKEKYGIDI